jgi:hypothetical protein
MLSNGLGWKNLRIYKHKYINETIYWFSEGNINTVCFHINILPYLHLAVFAVQYGVFTGWHKADIDNPKTEVSRLFPIFSKKNFSPLNIPSFIKHYPQYAGFYWKEDGGIFHINSSRDFTNWHPQDILDSENVTPNEK